MTSVEEWRLDNSNHGHNSLNTARYGHGCTHFTDYSAEIIIVAGGYDSNGASSSVEKMMRSITGGPWSLWMSIGSLPQKRHFFPIYSWSDGRMYILGGYVDGIGVSDSVLSSEDGITWQTENITIPTGRYGHTVVSTEKLCQ